MRCPSCRHPMPVRAVFCPTCHTEQPRCRLWRCAADGRYETREAGTQGRMQQLARDLNAKQGPSTWFAVPLDVASWRQKVTNDEHMEGSRDECAPC